MTDLEADDAEAPARAAIATAPVLSVDEFEGPLDWLLEMARSRKIDLRRLSIPALIEAFAEALEQALRQQTGYQTLPLARWGDWLVMAATLAQLRSGLLLPAPEAKTEVPRHAETRNLRRLGRAQVQAAADWLKRQPQLGRDVFAGGLAEASSAVRPGGDLAELLRACLAALRLPDHAEVLVLQPLKLWPMAEAIARVRDVLATRPEGGELEAFLPENTDEQSDPVRHRAAVASTLLAGLELAREGHLTLEQAECWQPIRLRDMVEAMSLTGPAADDENLVSYRAKVLGWRS